MNNPMSSRLKILLEPIGFVRTESTTEEVKKNSPTLKIVLQCEFVDALEGIRGFSHLFVLFWLHEIQKSQRKILQVHPRGRKDLPLLGVFATRTMLRPNPIGLTLVELVKVEDNVLTVRGLDAFDGTPILDIKPFDPWDKAENAKVPDWWIRLKKEKKEKIW